MSTPRALRTTILPVRVYLAGLPLAGLHFFLTWKEWTSLWLAPFEIFAPCFYVLFVESAWGTTTHC